MRLINADKLKREDLCEICLSADCGDCFSDKNFAEWIASQPTVYDIDKIVQQLEGFKELECGDTDDDIELYELGRSQGKLEAYLNAIEIIKDGYEEIYRKEYDTAGNYHA